MDIITTAVTNLVTTSALLSVVFWLLKSFFSAKEENYRQSLDFLKQQFSALQKTMDDIFKKIDRLGESFASKDAMNALVSNFDSLSRNASSNQISMLTAITEVRRELTHFKRRVYPVVKAAEKDLIKREIKIENNTGTYSDAESFNNLYDKINNKGNA